MRVTSNIHKITSISHLVSIVVEADDALSLKAEYDRKLVEGSHIEGFRKGKAPIGVVAAKIGRNKYWKDLREYIASEALTEALKKEDIEPVVAPKYEFADWEEGGKFVFTATIYTKPPDPSELAAHPDIDLPGPGSEVQYSRPIRGVQSCSPEFPFPGSIDDFLAIRIMV